MPGKQLPPPSDSSRAKNADLDYFFGPDETSRSISKVGDLKTGTGMLGEPLAHFGKAAVMAAANCGSAPKFSKYSGVCEWNNCVFLWVNVMKKVGAGYGNTFNEEGRFMTWFGGSKMCSGHTSYSNELNLFFLKSNPDEMDIKYQRPCHQLLKQVRLSYYRFRSCETIAIGCQQRNIERTK